eukprot:g7671.t2
MASNVSDDVTAEVKRVVRNMGSTVVDIVDFTHEFGGDVPVVGAVLKTLTTIREKAETVQSNMEELKELEKRCTYVTARVIVKLRHNSGLEMDVTPLESCVTAAEEFIERCGRRGWCGRCTKASSDKDEIAKLNVRVDRLIGDMGLAAIANVGAKIDGLTATLTQTPATVPVAAVPKGKPAEHSWHVARDRVVDAVYEQLSCRQVPQVVGLVGRSGSGKTTCAASIVGEPKGGSSRHQNGTADQVLRRQNRVREHFCDGVVWLRVGRGAGSAERVPALMSLLAKTVYEELADSYGFAPGASPNDPRDGSAFIRNFVCGTGRAAGQKRCLIVADDVWEVDILEELRNTGMWVLFTTRNPRLVETVEGSVVPVDQLSKSEAESLLSGAAELSTGSSLPSVAAKIIERCDRMANHLEFVGRWSIVKGSDDEEDWAEALSAIDAEMSAISGEAEAQKSDEGLLAVKRAAILRAGFLDLAAQNAFNPLLYLSLAVMPDGHAFGAKEAAVLLYDDGADEGASRRRTRQAGKVVANLEQWAVVTMHGDSFRMHDAHTEFARNKLKKSEDVRASAVRRWRGFISTLATVRSTDYFELVDLWHATEAVGGESWRVSRPYHVALDSIQDSSSECIPTLKAVVEFGINECAWDATHGVALRLLRVQKDTAVVHAEVRNTLESLIHCANALDLTSDADAYRRELSSMVDVAWEKRSHAANSPPRLVAEQLLERGQQLAITRRPDEAHEAISEALRIQEGGADFESLEISETLEFLAIVLVDLKRYNEGVEVYQRCLRIKEGLYGHEHLRLTVTLHNLAVCALKRGGPGDVEQASGLLRRALSIKEAKTGEDHVGMVRTLHWLRRCAEQAGKSDEENRWKERIKRLEDANTKRNLSPPV